ncbi:ATP-binding protein [Saccharopolyspora sp. NPDC000359]|uniref:ATP-binding protein n=1 Tax=Saccharopolyspora sp. NPDC000359 TaxID=3154251 RepID=UPI00332B2F13
MGQEERRTSFNSISGRVFGLAVQAGEIHGNVHFHSGAQDGRAGTVWDFVSSKPGDDRGTTDRQAVRKQVDWPVLVGVVPQLASSFQQRALSEELGNELEREWSQGDKQSVPEEEQRRRRHHVLTGLGGVGKTQLAAQLAQRFVRQWRQDRDGQLLDLLVWITADSRDAIVNGYARVADKLSLPKEDDFDGDTTANRCQQFLTWMETTSRRWLIILDDLQSPRDLNGLWPPDAGHTIVTTRRRSEPAFDGRHVIEVGLFGRQESLNYFRTKLGERYQAEDAAKLADDLGYLPLALAQAAAYIATRGITCSEYRRRLADKRRRLADVFPDDEGLPDEHKTTLAATWSLSIHAANPRSSRRHQC